MAGLTPRFTIEQQAVLDSRPGRRVIRVRHLAFVADRERTTLPDSNVTRVDPGGERRMACPVIVTRGGSDLIVLPDGGKIWVQAPFANDDR